MCQYRPVDRSRLPLSPKEEKSSEVRGNNKTWHEGEEYKYGRWRNLHNLCSRPFGVGKTVALTVKTEVTLTHLNGTQMGPATSMGYRFGTIPPLGKDAARCELIRLQAYRSQADS